jgi:hypothetical protein
MLEQTMIVLIVFGCVIAGSLLARPVIAIVNAFVR